MSVNIYDSTNDELLPLAGVPLLVLNNKANKDEISSTDKAETTTTATKAHTEGDYFDLNGTFVKALDDISIGDTLVEGTNIETTDVGSELSSKANTSSIPTKVSDLQNDSGFVNHDTTYESKTASSGGSDVSLVTTGEKYTWNNKADSSSVTTLTNKLTVVDPDEGSGLITFGVDANGNYGYKKVGADTVTPFLTGGGGKESEILNIYLTYMASSPGPARGYLYSARIINLFYQIDIGYVNASNLSLTITDRFTNTVIYTGNVTYNNIQTILQDYFTLFEISCEYANTYPNGFMLYIKVLKNSYYSWSTGSVNVITASPHTGDANNYLHNTSGMVSANTNFGGSSTNTTVNYYIVER